MLTQICCESFKSLSDNLYEKYLPHWCTSRDNLHAYSHSSIFDKLLQRENEMTAALDVPYRQSVFLAWSRDYINVIAVRLKGLSRCLTSQTSTKYHKWN